jgi:hypothetical protein
LDADDGGDVRVRILDDRAGRLGSGGAGAGGVHRTDTRIPEHVAWEIRELAEEEDFSWACIAPALAG